MKFLEGKTPAERNKTIAAIVLGLLAVIAVGYNLLPASSKSSKSNNTNSNARVVATNGSNSNSSERQIPPIAKVREEDPYADLTPIPENPFPPVFGGETSRNIFAIYEPPPVIAKPSVIPVPPVVPAPTPYILVQFVSSNPNPVYARQGDFTLEVSGDKFTADSKVLFNGQEIPTQFGGAQRLTAQVPAALIATDGQRQITVRSQDGSKMSNVMTFNVQAQPLPNYNFVGLVAPTRYNNVRALLQEKSSKEYKNVRLGETIGRFKVFSISSKEIVMQDTSLNFRHNLPFMDEKMASKTAGNSGSGGSASQPNNDPPNNGFPQGFDPNMQIQQYQQNIPGIPSQYTQQQQMPMQPQPQAAPPKKDATDDNDDDNN